MIGRKKNETSRKVGENLEERPILRGAIRRIAGALNSILQWSTKSLLRHIIFMTVTAAILFTVMGLLWDGTSRDLWEKLAANWYNNDTILEHTDRVKLSFTAIGGFGGIIYLVIKYRERHGIESSEAEQKMVRAVQQLGSESPQVRIAGVYSLTDVADTYRGDYRQRVLDILCGYLRSERRTWDVEGSSYLNKDSVLEDIVINVISQHMRKERKKSDRCGIIQNLKDDQLWCDCSINLRGAVITELVDFSNLCFEGPVDLRFTVFNREVDFQGTRLADADLSKCRFLGGATFANGELEKVKFVFTEFGGVDPTEYVNFDGTVFHGVEFQSVKFGEYTSFEGAKFLETTFTDIQPDEPCEEVESIELNFGGRAEFSNVHFDGVKVATAVFSAAIFKGCVSFKDVTFRMARFSGSEFMRPVVFEEVHFKGSAHFEKTTFNEVDFGGAFFSGLPIFSGSTFNKGHNLSRNNFLGEDPIGLIDNWLIEGEQEGGGDMENDRDDE